MNPMSPENYGKRGGKGAAHGTGKVKANTLRNDLGSWQGQLARAVGKGRGRYLRDVLRYLRGT